jgi:hypothetical protein
MYISPCALFGLMLIQATIVIPAVFVRKHANKSSDPLDRDPTIGHI